MNVKEAEKILKEIGLELKIEDKQMDKINSIILEQLPYPGIEVKQGSTIDIILE